ncbi:MAG: permease [Vicinamibacterales bacterium]|nr:permease [Vicinamibacterales bacterium]
MDWRREWKWLVLGVGGFAAIFLLPVGAARFDGAVLESLHLLKWYAREHVLLCLIPAFFIAGAITVFVSQAAIMKYLGPGAHKGLAYAVGSVSGTVLAVCSCTVLPLFAGIYKRGAGLGPATAFLYSGPAINVLAIVLTARVLGWKLGLARAVGAVVFAIVIGLIMHALFRADEDARTNAIPAAPPVAPVRTLGQDVTYFAALVGILVFANWAEPSTPWGFWSDVFAIKWLVTGVLGLGLGVMLVRWFQLPAVSLAAVVLATIVAAVAVPGQPLIPFTVAIVGLSIVTSRDAGEAGEWFTASWDYARQITPLLLGGVLLAGLLLGRPGHEGLIPSEWVSRALGGNALGANVFASVAGAFMYFATLTEVPIVQGLIGSGMGQGPALALLLAGPALSLPSILVVRSVLGTAKTATYVLLVIVMATVSGLVFGAWA